MLSGFDSNARELAALPWVLCGPQPCPQPQPIEIRKQTHQDHREAALNCGSETSGFYYPSRGLHVVSSGTPSWLHGGDSSCIFNARFPRLFSTWTQFSSMLPVVTEAYFLKSRVQSCSSGCLLSHEAVSPAFLAPPWL